MLLNIVLEFAESIPMSQATDLFLFGIYHEKYLLNIIPGKNAQ